MSVADTIEKAEREIADMRELLKRFPDAVHDEDYDLTGRVWLSELVTAETSTHLLNTAFTRKTKVDKNLDVPLPGVVVGNLFVTRPGWPKGARESSTQNQLETILRDLAATDRDAFLAFVRCAAARLARD